MALILNFQNLRTMHPLLPPSLALDYTHTAALGLQRHGHAPGCNLTALICGKPADAKLDWLPAPQQHTRQINTKRMIEVSAETIALALVHESRGWTIRRRLQQGEAADWLLADRASRRVALEVSGTDHYDLDARLRTKLQQVADADAATKSACVVALADPRAILAIL